MKLVLKISLPLVNMLLLLAINLNKEEIILGREI